MTVEAGKGYSLLYTIVLLRIEGNLMCIVRNRWLCHGVTMARVLCVNNA